MTLGSTDVLRRASERPERGWLGRGVDRDIAGCASNLAATGCYGFRSMLRTRHSVNSSDPLAGRVVVVTGAARGIGEAIARQLAERGARVALGDIDFEAARRLATQLPRSRAYQLDVRAPESLAAMLGALEEELGPVDVLVNNAAVMALGPFLEVSEEKIRAQIETNLMGVIHAMRLTLPKMVARGRGHVINMNSSAGKWTVPGENAYVAAKFATSGLSGVVRRELRGSGVDISVIHFGPTTQTELALGMRSVRAVRMISREHVGRAVLSTLERPRFEVWVPSYMGWLYAGSQLVPSRLRYRAEQLSGLEQVATQVDWSEREPYEARVFSR